MPLETYDQYFGGKRGDAAKAARALRNEYGSDKGKQYFYAIVHKRRKEQRG